MRSIDEFRTRKPPVPKTASEALQVLAREAVHVDALTGDPAWDHYNTFIQFAIRDTEARREAALKMLCNPLLVRDEDIRVCKIRLAELESRIGALKEVMALPKYLKEKAALAQRQIAELAGP